MMQNTPTRAEIRRAERTEFENFARGADLAADRYGNYLNAQIDFAFRAWCRRAQMPSENGAARWIEAADFLPEYNQPVLAFCRDGSVLAVCRSDRGWISLMIAAAVFPLQEVLFWQPWPAPPRPQPWPSEKGSRRW